MISGSFFYLLIFFNRGIVEGIYLIHELIEGLRRVLTGPAKMTIFSSWNGTKPAP